ncbi:hypothetical protein LMG26857_03456 [Achromobacter anxifer]|uniref:ADP-ribosyltransferase-containing protein n=1 Tax=Achromobacter anxifer TaxID=1287737 RepID=UPI00155B8982|nr:hypothetical protein [Achromobacter anxifer]CAB5514397.1 hypothetical protein LMG26857_03456 [Achromobacter anxifer]
MQKVHTAGFQAWFESSVITDSGQPDGAPLVVYHGTPNRDFRAFSYTPIRRTIDCALSRCGFFFAAAKREADCYAWHPHLRRRGRTIAAHLAIRKPLVVDGRTLGVSEHNHDLLARVITWAKTCRKAFDGVIIHNWSDGLGTGTQYIVFKPEQIKSSRYNCGAFDGSNPEIYA